MTVQVATVDRRSLRSFAAVDDQGFALGVVKAVVGGEVGDHDGAEVEDDQVNADDKQRHPDAGGVPGNAVLRQGKAFPVPEAGVERLNLQVKSKHFHHLLG